MGPPYYKPPEGWLECPKYGEIIDGTFMPLKTPLSEQFPLKEEEQLTPEQFVQHARDSAIPIGLVINLTYSERYYDSEKDFFAGTEDIELKHIFCRGFNVPPVLGERLFFNEICNSFLSSNPSKIIAVHCTHGFNRTGFMICQYLCMERHWTIEAAVAEFAAKRPPGIFRENLLYELFNVFDGKGRVPVVPTMPYTTKPKRAHMPQSRAMEDTNWRASR